MVTFGFSSLELRNKAIRHAWHFYHALVLVIKAVCSSIGIRCLTP
ncbi:DUF3265 domain-containing protein [Vibrio cholerae]|nr:DUF3265 domain-containing protein [Vibrio cholerae]